MRGRLIEPFEDLGFPDGQELEVAVNPAEESGHLAIVAALTESAGAWTDDAHPELATRNDVIGLVASGRADFDRQHG
jgi:hypothetical protein